MTIDTTTSINTTTNTQLCNVNTTTNTQLCNVNTTTNTQLISILQQTHNYVTSTLQQTHNNATSILQQTHNYVTSTPQQTLLTTPLNPPALPELASVCSNPLRMTPILVGCLPSWLRLAQCIRRYRDTGEAFPHLANAFKYSMPIFISAFGYLEYSHAGWWGVVVCGELWRRCGGV